MRYESEMIASIKTCLASALQDSILVEEFGVGYGVADVIAARLCLDGIHIRLNQMQTASLPGRGEVKVLYILRDVGVASFVELLDLTGISANRLRYDVLKFLLTENYIEETKGIFKLQGEYRPVAHEIWAVEAKMKNWSKGLCQAKRYQHFAHRAYLAISAHHRKNVSDETLQEQNVGLIEVSHETAKIVFHPSWQNPRSKELFLLSNERIWDWMHSVV